MKTQFSRETDGPARTKENIDRVVDQVYQKYGSNLSAFFADIQRQLEMERCEAAADPNPKERG